MTLTLKIVNKDQLQNGSPIELVLHNRGAIIGRSNTCEWPLPDDERLLSRNHCKITFNNDRYHIEDMSVNGTFLDQNETPLDGEHCIAPNDKFRVAQYVIKARLSGDALAAHNAEVSRLNNANTRTDWNDWGDGTSDNNPETPNTDSPWDIDSTDNSDVSPWSDKKHDGPLPQTSDEIFNTLSNNHEVDWDDAAWNVNAEFDPFATLPNTTEPTTKDPFGTLEPDDTEDWGPASTPHDTPNNAEDSPEFWNDWEAGENPTRLPETIQPQSQPPKQIAKPPAKPSTPTPAVTPAASIAPPPEIYRKLISEIGISADKLTGTPEETAARSGRMLRRLLAGLITLLEARTRAKDAMGASATQLTLDGNNPLKFARDIDQALQMVMNPARPGYMDIDLTIEDSFKDIQAHQIATIKAMQGALKSTLNRFSPNQIKSDAKRNGFLTKILPGQRDAALWRAYEQQFNGSVEGSAEAFFDVFSKEFRDAYEEATRKK